MGNAARLPAPDLRGPQMVRVPGGEFLMGSDSHYPEEAPAHRVRVGAFLMDRTAVTNRQFAAFVADTGHVTVAERPLDPALYPGLPSDRLQPGSAVFRMTRGPVDLRDVRQWWVWTAGACWRHPEGPGSSIKARKDHPVIHVAYEDAEAFAAWAGKALPTEAEWEFAARGGLDGAEFAWGDELAPRGRHRANTWQGAFPWQDLAEDGHAGTCAVQSYPPNGYGLYEVCGNVWEWTTDWYADRHAPANAARPTCCTLDNPRGPDAQGLRRRVIKGGSFLCAPSYCRRYRPAARHPQAIDTGTSHIGFRCIVRG